MKKIIFFVFVIGFAWYAYMTYLMDFNEYGISIKAPIGTFGGLNGRLSHSRFVKKKKSLGRGLKAYYYVDPKSKGYAKEKVVIIADREKVVKGIVVYYAVDPNGRYKTPITRFLLKYWRQLNDDRMPRFEEVRPGSDKEGVQAVISASGVKGRWIQAPMLGPLSCAVIHLSSISDPKRLLAGKSKKRARKSG